MLSKEEIIAKAVECGFEDTGFTTAEPFDSQRALLEGMREEYGWAIQSGLDLIARTDPKTVLPRLEVDHRAGGGLFQGGLPPGG